MRPTSRTLPGSGLGGREGRHDTQLSPACMRWMRWLLPYIGPLLAAASAGPQPSWASGQPARTPPGREGLGSEEQPRCMHATHCSHEKTGSQSSRADGSWHQPMGFRELWKCLPHPSTRAPFLLLPVDASLGSSSQVLPTARSPPAPRDTARC